MTKDELDLMILEIIRSQERSGKMTADELELAFLEAAGKRVQEQIAELERQIIAAPPEDRWGEKYYALVVGDKVIVQEIISDKGSTK